MNAFFQQLIIQFRMDGRDLNTLLVFYIVPVVFYVVMGAVFSSVIPGAGQTLTATMVIFAVTMGALLGVPPTLVKMRETGVLRAYHVSGIPGASVLLSLGASVLIHLSIVSVLITVSAPVLFGAAPPQQAGGFAAVLAAMLLCSVALGLLIGVTAKNQAMSVMLSQLVFLPSVMLGGIMFPASMLPAPLRLLGRILPATHAMQAFNGLAYGLSADFNAPTALGVVLGIGLAAAVLTVWRFGRITRIS